MKIIFILAFIFASFLASAQVITAKEKVVPILSRYVAARNLKPIRPAVSLVVPVIPEKEIIHLRLKTPPEYTFRYFHLRQYRWGSVIRF